MSNLSTGVSLMTNFNNGGKIIPLLHCVFVTRVKRGNDSFCPWGRLSDQGTLRKSLAYENGFGCVVG